MTSRILGLSAFYHDSAAALLTDGRVAAAAQEERFSRIRHDAGFPHHAIAHCLETAGLAAADIDLVVFYEKPWVKFERLMGTWLATAPKGFGAFLAAMPLWLKDKLFQKGHLAAEMARFDAGVDWRARILFSEHHLSHAASAFFPSPFDEAVVLTLDGTGEWATTSAATGRGNTLEPLKEIRFPHSLGLLYSAFTQYTGFKVNSGEYKLMGLAPYGEPRYAGLIRDHLIELKPDGSFRLDLGYFDYTTGRRMINDRFAELFGQPERQPESPLTQFHMDVAASIQQVTEEAVLHLTRALAAETGLANLCLAGGVALNCVANGKVLRDGRFKGLWIQPAAGDAGGALGAAYVAHHLYNGQPRKSPEGRDAMRGALLGPGYGDDEIENRLTRAGARLRRLAPDALVDAVAQALAGGKSVGWMQDRMEFGPRALGARSILADPRSPVMQRQLNLQIKYRESFRPFAPAVLAEDAARWFELEGTSPYMLLVAPVRGDHRRAMTEAEQTLFGIDKLNVVRSAIPAVTHVDYSARVQTVESADNPRFHALLGRFKALTGCPVLVNTSFNVRGEPIVCTPEDAFRCFMGTELDVLAVGNCLLVKDEQDSSLAKDYKNAFALD